MGNEVDPTDISWYETLKEELVAENAFLKSEYFQRFGAGELDKEQVWGHLSQQYLLVSYFPRVLSGIHSRCDVLEIRKECAKHLLVEDLGYFKGKVFGTPDHVELFKRIGDDLGYSRDTYAGIKPIPEMASRLKYLEKLAHEVPWTAALCATSLGENQVVSASRVVGGALVKHYGCRPEWGGINYVVHAQVEEEEAGDTEAVVLSHITTKQARAAAEEAMRQAHNDTLRYAEGLRRQYLARH